MKNQTPLLAALIGCALLASAGGLLAQNPDLPYSSGSNGSDLALTFPQSPPGRSNASTAYDTVRNRLVLFGGYTQNGGYNAETWEWDGTAWAVKNPATSPSARNNTAMVYDSVRHVVVLFGGNATNTLMNDTWEWDGTNWTQKTTANSPPVRSAHAMAYDSNRQKVVLFGGYSYLHDTWEYDGTNWTEKTSATVPSDRWDHAMAYDANRQKVVMHGGTITSQGDTWEWDGTLWVQKLLTPAPGIRSEHAMAYDSVRQRIVLFGGFTASTYDGDTWEYDGTAWVQKLPAASPPSRGQHAMAYDTSRSKIVLVSGNSPLATYADDTWEWDGTKWLQRTGSDFFFDMTSRPSGTWQYTTITIPATTKLRFIKNSSNAPVTWLASGAVQIDGEINLDGTQPPGYVNTPGTQGRGGPAGFDGGLGGTRFSASSSFAGTPGQGPGGGAPGTTNGQYGLHATGNYGNAYLQPLVGGSGGGGGASNDTSDGGNGGGGGGAILIASSLDINVNGSIHALGGTGNYGGATNGGNGSGGSIRLVADRVSGTGTVNAGRLRFEGYFRSLLQGGTITSVTSNTSSTPVATAAIGSQPALAVTSVAGLPVAQPPSGNPAAPDVVFSTAGTINVVVTGTNIPDGTAVTCRVTSGSQIINLPAAGYPAVTLAGGTATFSTTVQPGVGSVQAFASFTTGP